MKRLKKLLAGTLVSIMALTTFVQPLVAYAADSMEVSVTSVEEIAPEKENNEIMPEVEINSEETDLETSVVNPDAIVTEESESQPQESETETLPPAEYTMKVITDGYGTIEILTQNLNNITTQDNETTLKVPENTKVEFKIHANENYELNEVKMISDVNMEVLPELNDDVYSYMVGQENITANISFKQIETVPEEITGNQNGSLTESNESIENESSEVPVDAKPITEENREVLYDSIVKMNLMGLGISRMSLGAIPSVGETTTGNCYIGAYQTIGNDSYFDVSSFSGLLTGGSATGSFTCLDPTAAEPSYTGASYLATVTSVNVAGGYVEFYVYVTPPGVTTGVVDGNGHLQGYQHVGGYVRVPWAFSGKLRIAKTSSNPTISNGNGCYSLAGAVYGIYRDQGCTQLIQTLTTDANGNTPESSDLTQGTYYVKEITPPQGFALDNAAHAITITSGQTVTSSVSDAPQNDPVAILLGKVDKETNANKPQGSASLENAEFTIKYYANYDASGDAVRTWVLKTDADGFSALDAAYKVSGDDFYRSSKGDITLPLGSITIQETKAPEGYVLDDTIFTRKITNEGTAESVFTYNMPTVEEQVIRGDLEIIKLVGDDKEEEDETVKGLQGAEFTITSLTTNEVVGKIVSDESGLATTETIGGLVYDSYRIEETKTPEGFRTIEPFNVTIKEHGKTIRGIYKQDVPIKAGIKLVKTDKSTGKTIPLAGTKFRILDADKNVVSMTTYYPQMTTVSEFVTDETGSCLLPERLHYGTFYLEELQAPSGYLLGALQEFKVTEYGTWDDPIVVSMADDNAMGRVQVTKTNKENGTVLEGAVFEITAAEDIVTGDGTLRAAKGDVVDTITSDAAGVAVSKDLFLGKYNVREVKAPLGFACDTEKIYEAVLAYQDQNTAIVTTEINVENTPTSILINKVVKDTNEPLEGVTFHVWNEAMSSTDDVDDEMGTKESYVTDEKGQIEIKYLTAGTYCIQESATVTGYCLNDEIKKFTVDENGLIDGKTKAEFLFENEATAIAKTTALDKDTNSHNAVATDKTTYIDKVEFTGANIGTTYELETFLINAATGENIIDAITGEKVTAKTTFIAESKNGIVEVEFTFNASTLQGVTTVVFEDLYQDGIKIYSHADLNDKNQQVTFPKIKIGTQATDKASGTHDMTDVSSNATIADIVTISGLPEGTTGTFELKGNIVKFGTGGEITINGKPIVASKTFDKTTGTETLEFTFDAKELLNTDVTVYEELYYNGTKIAEHKDPNSEDQTVHIKGKGKIITSTPSNFRDGKGVKTGDNTGLSILFVLFAGSVLCILVEFVFDFYKRRKMKKLEGANSGIEKKDN